VNCNNRRKKRLIFDGLSPYQQQLARLGKQVLCHTNQNSIIL